MWSNSSLTRGDQRAWPLVLATLPSLVAGRITHAAAVSRNAMTRRPAMTMFSPCLSARAPGQVRLGFAGRDRSPEPRVGALFFALAAPEAILPVVASPALA